MIWCYYLALEPAVRRRWPEMLISWSRLLAGRFSDPLVGRDVLLGGLAGLALLATMLLAVPVSARLGSSGEPYLGAADIAGARLWSCLSAPRHLAHFFFRSPALCVIYALVAALELYIFQIVLRRPWLARGMLFLVNFLILLGASENPFVGAVVGAVFAGIFVTVLVHLGLLSLVATFFVWNVLIRTPLTLDASAWYAGRSFVILAFFAALFTAAFYTSLGGKPLFGRALIDD